MAENGAIVGDVVVKVNGAVVQPNQSGQFRAPQGSDVEITLTVHNGLCTAISADAYGVRNVGTVCDPGNGPNGDETTYTVTGEIDGEAAGITIDTGTDGDPPAGGAGAESVTATFDVS